MDSRRPLASTARRRRGADPYEQWRTDVRLGAVVSLASIGPGARPAGRPLVRALQGDGPRVAPSHPTFQRPPELVQVVVVMSGEPGSEVADGHPAPRWVDTTAVPLLSGKPLEESQHFFTPSAKCSESLTCVVTEVLTLLSPTARIERVTNRPPDPPVGQITRSRIEGQDSRFVHSQHRQESREKQFLNISQMTDDLLRRPVLGIRAAREGGIVSAPDGGGKFVRGVLQAPEAFLGGHSCVVLHRRHRGVPPGGETTLAPPSPVVNRARSTRGAPAHAEHDNGPG